MDAKGNDTKEEPQKVRYRYRTSVLLGRWKSSPKEAAQDAIRAGQAEPCETGQHGIRWRLNGEIEEETGPCGRGSTGGK